MKIVVDSKQYKIVEDILFNQVGDEGILLHISSGTYYCLNEISVIFWLALSEAQSLDLVIDEVISEYEVERERVFEDLQNFIQDLSKLNLISPTVS